MPGTKVETVANLTFKVKEGFHHAVDTAIRKAALDCESQAKLNIRDQNAIDTGALLNSVYAVTSSGSKYAVAQAKAAAQAAKGSKSKRKKGATATGAKSFTPLPPETVGPIEGIVAVGAEYGHLVEFGTVHTPARPFLNPAFATVAKSFEEVVSDMIDKVIDSI